MTELGYATSFTVEKIEMFLEKSTDAFFALNNQWQFVYVNLQAEKHLNKDRANLLGRNIWDTFPSLVESPLYHNYHKSMEQKVQINFEEFFAPLNAWFEVCVVPFTEGISVYFRDITEIKRIMENLKNSNDRYSALFHNKNIAMFIVDFESKYIIDVNEAACNFYGYTKDEFLARKYCDLTQFTEEEALKMLNCDHNHIEFQLQLANGEVKHTEAFCTPITINDRKLVYVIVYDITERKKMEQALIDSERKFKQLFEDANDAIFLHGYLDNGLPDKFLEVNETACKIFGFSKEEFKQISPIELEGQDNSESLVDTSSKVLKRESTTFERNLLTRGGTRKPFEISTHIFELKGKKMAISVARDISDRKKAQQEIIQAYKELKNIFDLSADGMCIINKNFEIIRANKTFAGLCGLEQDQVLGKKCYHLLEGKACRTTSCGLNQILKGKDRIEAEVEKININNERKICSINVIPYKDKDGNIIGIVESIKDITEKKQAENLIKHMAYHDSLTDLPNRRLFNEELTKALWKAFQDNEYVAIVFLDLDKFKIVNDTLGHEFGDRLLQEVAYRLRSFMLEDILVARMGGDEFILLIPGMSEELKVEKVVNDICQMFRETWLVDNQKLEITASIGVAIYPNDGEDAVTLLKNADIAMYRAKELGGNDYQRYTVQLNEKITDKLSLENSLRAALENNEFVLHYQPQININNGNVIGMEALLRWQRSGSELISPDKFIPIAEETGLIIPIGEWVIRTACQQNKQWQKDGFAPLRVAVNLSPKQFRNENLAQTIEEILQETELDPRWLELEITESAMMRDADYVNKTLKDLKELGVRILIDDFGTGYSSLGYLKRFPIDGLKIDRSFVRDLTTNKNDEAIVKAIIAMANGLKYEVIAEGVETKKQLNLLKRKKCTKMQGYFFGKPMSKNDFETTILNKK